METILAPILLYCPECNTNFEFDAVGEHEYVSCPICGSDYVTVKKGRKLKLEAFEQTQICCPQC